MTNDELILKVVKIISNFDEVSISFIKNSTMFKYNKEDGNSENVRFFTNCNDIFWWGCADSEEITEDNIDIFEQSLKDSKYYGEYLFCARVRKMRPQGAFYKDLSEEDKKLFNEVGPEREIDFCNPYSQDYKYEYKKKEEQKQELK